MAPWLAGKPVEQALAALIIPHAFRHLGLVFLVPGVLAIAALVPCGVALPLVWLFNVVGSVDLRHAVLRGLVVNAQQSMGAAWYIPTFIVPALVVSHVMVFAWLLRVKSVMC